VLEDAARTIIDANLYMTLATADEGGRPWASPVYYAPFAYTQFLWVSAPDATHSRNVGSRPEVGIVIFDSRTPINTGQGVYVSAVAERLKGDDIDRGIEIFSRRSQEHGAGEWTRADVVELARLRLYRATASEIFVLDGRDQRIPVRLG
jgi:uncharacterized protein YhbP (UPF0306 family)